MLRLTGADVPNLDNGVACGCGEKIGTTSARQHVVNLVDDIEGRGTCEEEGVVVLARDEQRRRYSRAAIQLPAPHNQPLTMEKV